jgi:hypothetical protein
MAPTPIEWIPWDDKQKAVVRRGPHHLEGKILHWRFCTRCGLMNLKNDATRAALKKQCEWIEDS